LLQRQGAQANRSHASARAPPLVFLAVSTVGIALSACVRRLAAHMELRSSEGSVEGVAGEPAEQEEEMETIPEEGEEELPAPRPPFDPAAQVGALEPLGFFDPLEFCPAGDEGKFRGLRAAELKHGRVAMMAAVGAAAQHYIRFPFFGLSQSPSGLKAIYQIPSAWFFTLLVFACAVVELLFWTQDPKREPGNFGDPLGLGMYDKEMRNRELNNGRFAMFAAAGIIAAELFTGKDAIQQLGL